MGKVKWSGGKYGELPYVNIGNISYVIRDFKIDGKYKYILYRKLQNHKHTLHKPKDTLKYLAYGEKVFLRWYMSKHKNPPFKENIRFDGKTVIYTDRTLRFRYFVNNEEIIIYDNGVPLGYYYNTMAEAKKNAEQIILKAIEEYQRENQIQMRLGI